MKKIIILFLIILIVFPHAMAAGTNTNNINNIINCKPEILTRTIKPYYTTQKNTPIITADPIIATCIQDNQKYQIEIKGITLDDNNKTVEFYISIKKNILRITLSPQAFYNGVRFLNITIKQIKGTYIKSNILEIDYSTLRIQKQVIAYQKQIQNLQNNLNNMAEKVAEANKVINQIATTLTKIQVQLNTIDTLNRQLQSQNKTLTVMKEKLNQKYYKYIYLLLTLNAIVALVLGILIYKEVRPKVTVIHA